MNSFKGYGFRPSERELIGYLRNRTLLDGDCLVQDIIDLGVDICRWDPWDLPRLTSVSSCDPVWYFIYPITYKHTYRNRKMIGMATDKGPNGKRKPINRATHNGKWKVSGERLKVRASDSEKEIIGVKTRLYFYKGLDNEENNKKSKAKRQNSYPCKTPWVLYEYELTNVDSCKNKYFLGKLMMKQSEPTNKSSSKDQTSQQVPPNSLGNEQIPTQVQVSFDNEPLVELYNDFNWVQNQFSISEQATEIVNPCPVYNYEMNPELETSATAENEVTTHLQTSNLENYGADFATPQNLQELLMDLIREPGEPNLCVGDGNQNDPSIQNSAPIDNGDAKRRDQHNVVAESEGFSLPNNFNNYHMADLAQMVQVGLPMVEMEVYSDNGWVQNQYSISEQATEIVNPCCVSNYEMHPEEISARAENEMIANQHTSNLENYDADCAILQNLELDIMDLITEPEVPESDLCVGEETQQQDLSSHNPAPIDNGEAEEGINIV